MKYFYSSFIIAFFGLAGAFFIGGFVAVYICFLLCILEISLSFDNAVVNAKVLRDMSPQWQRRFIVWGIPVAVFGMRFVFPILIVAVAAKISMFETLNIAINDPHKYHEILSMSKDQIYVFGTGFLLMVFNDFFLDKERDVDWIKIVEGNFISKFMKKIPNMSAIIAVGIGLILIFESKNPSYGVAYFSAILIHMIISSISEVFSVDGVRSGLMGFLYLEVLDASFSFDGVIGAFALSENIFIIMIGLGVGAMFVRSITIYLVERKTLNSFIYLEHGAHYAILALALIMFMKIYTEISESITGTIGFGFILAAFICSLIHKKRTQKMIMEVQASNDE